MNALASITMGLALAVTPIANPLPSTTRTSDEARLGNLADTIATRGDLTIFTKTIEASGLENMLTKEGPFTILAPTDEAFHMLPEGMLEDLLQPENRASLAEIMRYHIIPGRMPASRITTGETTTLQGSKIAFNADGGTIWVGPAEVMKPDINATNGVIHTINMLMEPDEQ